MERNAKLSEENKAAAGPGRVEVKVRKRSSKRAVKKVEEDELEAAARSAAVGREMLDWYNTSVGESLLDYAQTGKGRRIHLLDTTKIEVELEAGNYECSGVVRDEDGNHSLLLKRRGVNWPFHRLPAIPKFRVSHHSRWQHCIVHYGRYVSRITHRFPYSLRLSPTISLPHKSNSDFHP